MERSFDTSESAKRRRRLLLVGLVVATILFVGLSWQRAAGAGGLGETLAAVLRPAPGPVRVGLQVGHLDAGLHPDELAKLRVNTGGRWGDVNEVDINLAVARQLKESLELDGVEVDLLPATVPEGYRADLVVSIHADASPDEARRGYKSAYFYEPRNDLEPVLKAHLDEAYFYYAGLPDDDANVSGSMLEYYAFNSKRFRHAVAPDTPAVIVELGYISNPDDLKFMQNPVNPAFALKRGIMSYLQAEGRLTVSAQR